VIPQTHIWSIYRYGSTSEACMKNGALYAELQLRALRDFGWDGIFVATDSVALAHSLGAPVEYTETGVAPASRGLLEDLKGVDALIHPDIRETRLNEWITATRLLVKEVGDRVLIIARADQGPFSLACQVRGMQDFMMELGTREHPDDLHALLRFSTEYVWQFADLLLEAGAHVVSIGDALASGSLIAPATFEEFAFPYQKEIARRVHQRGGLLSIHVCGHTTSVMNRLVATGADIVEFDAQTDFDTAITAARGKSCLLGNVDTSDVMTFGRPDAVAEECRWRLKKVQPASGYILSSGCALSPNSPAENIQAMIHAAADYGTY
ncbi:MAG: uroporphyrinogen decarboxylase family protein, partial [Bacteroidota bacterium]